MDLIDLARDMDPWRAVVNSAIIFSVAAFLGRSATGGFRKDVALCTFFLLS
jgi:hypothetical protein